MNLPIKFPSDTEVILKEVSRFRALTAKQQFEAIRSLLDAGEHVRRISPYADWASRYAEEQELLAQRNIKDFIARHGYR